MEVLPVIDLKAGVVVHARQGQRDFYRPIETPLSPSSVPSDLVGGLLRLYPFRRLYIADLDAIEKRGSHASTLAELAARFPGLELWVDNGIGELAGAAAWLARGVGCLVVGSESQTGPELLEELAGQDRLVLSLDFRGEAFQGPARILEDVTLWPARVIAMTLAQVGSGRGPDLARVAAIARRAPGRQIYAAGGVRHADDLAALASVGATGALVATALHAGTITVSDLWRTGREHLASE